MRFEAAFVEASELGDERLSNTTQSNLRLASRTAHIANANRSGLYVRFVELIKDGPPFISAAVCGLLR